MRTRDLFHDWQVFRRATLRPSLYILGAGASMPTIGGDFSAAVRDLVWQGGIYEGNREMSPSPLKERILRADVHHDLQAMLSGGIS